MTKSTKEEFQREVEATISYGKIQNPRDEKFLAELVTSGGVVPSSKALMGHDPQLDQLLKAHGTHTRDAVRARLEIFNHLHGRQEDGKK